MANLDLYSLSDMGRAIEIDDSNSSSTSQYRSAWRRDYARVIHSPSFRRLQGKTQLFYGDEVVVRNRLTHSLEVAQIAKAIALKINAEYQINIEPDIVEIAGLVHDLGHPPFGHNGEKALNAQMLSHGGFEGNAQTLRILTKLEKKQKLLGANKEGFDVKGNDLRGGLNLTYRVLASTLKYDSRAPLKAKEGSVPHKGYYFSDEAIVREIRNNVLGNSEHSYEGKFKTIECAIMDIADDIAYSTYDLEDALKANFIHPLQITAEAGSNSTSTQRIVEKVNKALKARFTAKEVVNILYELLAPELLPNLERVVAGIIEHRPDDLKDARYWLVAAGIAYRDALDLGSNGYRRVQFTSNLVNKFIEGVRVKLNTEYPAMSKVFLDTSTKQAVEVLKQYTYVSIIESPRLKIPEHRGYEIVEQIFKSLVSPGGEYLMPEDFQRKYRQINETDRRRLICDFIAGMTDKYALQVYNRLHADVPTTIFGPT